MCVPVLPTSPTLITLMGLTCSHLSHLLSWVLKPTFPFHLGQTVFSRLSCLSFVDSFWTGH